MRARQGRRSTIKGKCGRCGRRFGRLGTCFRCDTRGQEQARPFLPNEYTHTNDHWQLATGKAITG